MCRFLTSYFSGQSNAHVHLSDGHSVPLQEDECVDVIFVAGTIIALTLGTIHLYAREFSRVLKRGGVVIFDYLDPTTEGGWSFLLNEGQRLPDVYTYHAPQVIDRVFTEAGFADFHRTQLGKSTYFTATRVHG
jgi:ubiquinone/menaquinone biosynthesis C-methylase UbiE